MKDALIAAAVALGALVGGLLVTRAPIPDPVAWPAETFTLARAELGIVGEALAAVNPAVSPRLFHDRLIVPTLQRLDLYSPAAAQLLLATAVTESILYYSKQHNDGPALGYFQMEPATHDDIWARFLSRRENTDLRRRVLALLPDDSTNSPPSAVDMVLYPAYGVAMARIHYLLVRAPLPATGDAEAMARYWKRYYNTPRGAGTVAGFLAAWSRFNLGDIN